MDRQYQDIHILRRNPINMTQDERVIRMVEVQRVTFDETEVRVLYMINGYLYTVTFPKQLHKLIID